MKNKFVLLIAGITSISTHAAQCYPDAISAYQALVASERAVRGETININSASIAELTTLKGVGVKTAQAIVEYRQSFGRFERVEDLAKVKGIGERTIANNRHRLSVR